MNQLVTKIAGLYGRAVTKVKVKSPELYIIGGIVCVAAGVVMCCRATTKVDEIVEDHGREMQTIHERFDKENKMLLQKNTVQQYGYTFLRLVRVYAPGIGFTVLGVGFFLASYKILKARNIALIGAYNVLEASFQNFMGRVEEDYGEEYVYDAMHGIRKGDTVKIEEIDEEGNKTKKKIQTYDGDGKLNSPYAKFFDSSSKYWKPYSDVNMMFLKTQEKYANQRLKDKGCVFLNEVYDMLDIPPTPTGAVCGWILDGEGDGFIDFGIFDENGSVADRRFVNGYEDTVLLDFNCEGVIYDKI